jgi:FkbM family methyltransferase
MKQLKKQLSRVKRWFNKPVPKFPRVIEMRELSSQSVKFLIHSRTEFFRTKGFGNEREQLEKFLSFVEKNDVVYDIGASIGLLTVLTAVRCTHGQVLSFEPDPDIQRRLEENINLNKLKNVRVLPYAISNKDSQLNLYTAGTDALSPSLFEDPSLEALKLKAIDVEARSLDSIIVSDHLPAPTILKIDIEGAEYDALQGAIRLLKGDLMQAPRIIFIELHPKILSKSSISLEAIAGFFETCNYQKIWEIDRSAEIHQIYQKRV